MNFNKAHPLTMHLDVNSCFATIEQQANPRLRGKPVAVAAYPSSGGCILAASYEAKGMGVQTGMRVRDGKQLCPRLLVLPPDPSKYRSVHLKLRELLSNYSPRVYPKSIDEFVLHFDEAFDMHKKPMVDIAAEIKSRVRSEIGDAISVSVGIGPNRFLAKLAAGIEKPDGLIQIDHTNYERTYKELHVTDLCGIKQKNFARLVKFDVRSTWDFYNAPLWKLKAAFESINSYYWYMRLRGYEIDDVEYGRRSYGNSYSLPQPFSEKSELLPIVTKLVTKTSSRLRRAKLIAGGVHLALHYRDGTYWHRGHASPKNLFTTNDIYREVLYLWNQVGFGNPLRLVAISVFNLKQQSQLQLELFNNTEDSVHLMDAMDHVNERWGDYVVYPARMIATEKFIPDRIAFGGVKELEEIIQ